MFSLILMCIFIHSYTNYSSICGRIILSTYCMLVTGLRLRDNKITMVLASSLQDYSSDWKLECNVISPVMEEVPHAVTPHMKGP